MIFTGMRNPTRVTPFSSWLMEGVPPLDGGSRHIYVTWIEQSDLPQIPAFHVCCSSSVCRSRRGSGLVAIACSGEYQKSGLEWFPWVQSRWHQGRLETVLNTRALSNGRSGVQALSSA